jgi:hypothetical protein
LARTLAVLVACALFLCPTGSARANEELTLAGITRLRVAVDAFEDDERGAGFETSDFQAALEAKLRKAGIEVAGFDDPNERRTPVLFIGVSTMATREYPKAPFHAALELTQVVVLDRNQKRIPAITWKKARFGNGDASFVRNELDELTNEFLVDWLRVNPQPDPAPKKDEPAPQ